MLCFTLNDSWPRRQVTALHFSLTHLDERREKEGETTLANSRALFNFAAGKNINRICPSFLSKLWRKKGGRERGERMLDGCRMAREGREIIYSRMKRNKRKSITKMCVCRYYPEKGGESEEMSLSLSLRRCVIYKKERRKKKKEKKTRWSVAYLSCCLASFLLHSSIPSP